MDAIIAGGFVILFVSVLCLIPMGCLSTTENCCTYYAWLSLGLLVGLIQIGLGAMIVVYNGYADSVFNITHEKVQSMAYVNGCSDEYTKVD